MKMMKKLGRTIRYLDKTKHLPMILRVSDNNVIEWWIDASFAVHDDMKSRTGMQMSLGDGTIYGASVKQKINASSSTEAELAGVSDALPKMLWCRYFQWNTRGTLWRTSTCTKTMRVRSFLKTTV